MIGFICTNLKNKNLEAIFLNHQNVCLALSTLTSFLQILLTLSQPTWRSWRRWSQQQSSTPTNATLLSTAAARAPSACVTWGHQHCVTSTPNVSTVSFPSCVWGNAFEWDLMLPYEEGGGFNLCFFVCLCLPFFFSFRARTQSVTFLIDFFFFVLESRAAVITTLLPPECIHSCIKTSFQSGYTNDMHPFIFFFKCLKSQRIQTTVHSFLKSSHPSPT